MICEECDARIDRSVCRHRKHLAASFGRISVANLPLLPTPRSRCEKENGEWSRSLLVLLHAHAHISTQYQREKEKRGGSNLATLQLPSLHNNLLLLCSHSSSSNREESGSIWPGFNLQSCCRRRCRRSLTLEPKRLHHWSEWYHVTDGKNSHWSEKRGYCVNTYRGTAKRRLSIVVAAAAVSAALGIKSSSS